MRWLQAASLLVTCCCLCFGSSKPNPVSIHPLNRNSKELLTRSDFVFGKDRELFHASIDLKWLFGAISSKNTWISLFVCVMEKVKRLNSDYDSLIKYRETASEILLKFRYHNRDTELRVYQNSLLSGQSIAVAKRRLLVYYIEENVQNPSIETTEYRHALSDSAIGDTLNERFIFMASTEEHPFANQVLQAVAEYEDRRAILESQDNLNGMSSFGRFRSQDRIAFRNGKSIPAPVARFPTLVVMAPVPAAPRGLFGLGRFFAKTEEFAVVSVASIKRGEITAANLAGFLRDTARTHGGRVFDSSSPESVLFRIDNMHEPGV